MKKILYGILTLVLTLTLVACKPEKNPPNIDSPLLISKLMTDMYVESSVIEIYNPSDKEVDLKHHSIRIYAASTTVVDTTITLEGKIASKGFHVIAHDQSIKEALDKADQIYEGKRLNGSEAIVLFAGTKQIDTIGTRGSGISYINLTSGATYMRKADRLVQRETFQPFDFLELEAEMFDKLKTLETGITNEDLMYGPRLTDADREADFLLNGNNKAIGGGGAIEVELTGYGDGDTSTFKHEYLTGYTSTRYYYIDTPETQSSRVEEFGYVAANFTNNLLREATKIELQVPKGLSTDGSFNRFFGHVYVDGISVSYLLLRQGLAELGATTSSGAESENSYKNMRLEAWMRQADYYARENELGQYGETDPSFFYNGKDEAQNVGYRPFFLKPYEREGVKVVTNETELKSAIENNAKIVEIANDIELTETLNIENKKSVRVIGFGHKLTSKSDNVIEVKDSEFIYFENIIIEGGKTGFNVINTTFNINGYMVFNDQTETAFKLDATSELVQGTNSLDDYKGPMYVRYEFNQDKPFIIGVEGSTYRANTVFRGNSVLKEGTNWKLKITKP